MSASHQAMARAACFTPNPNKFAHTGGCPCCFTFVTSALLEFRPAKLTNAEDISQLVQTDFITVGKGGVIVHNQVADVATNVQYLYRDDSTEGKMQIKK
ncbi:hypothetical protein ACFX2J_016820 [Malus domestica]